ncbi:hypothetical protein B0O80DRAFT_463736 [Mortierella sp. GBAus27b]|nr:hypothetical protein BGX31_004462 [Mortierella sp. GBA43]KAI8348117.1 hypothetical protein B0O80DRAFT_463736 [Mortierella sp. GBAus27b]
MPPTNPLDLPEILSRVAEYVHEDSLPACARASKAWHAAFIPSIWRHIKTSTKYPEATLLAHAHLVKSLSTNYIVPADCVTWRFPNLESLNVSQSNRDLTELILGHPSIEHLVIVHFRHAQSIFWERLLTFKNLKSLHVSTKSVNWMDMDKLWQICTRLERLIIIMDEFVQNEIHPSPNLPLLKELHLNADDSARKHMEFLQKCPNLTTLVVQAEIHSDFISSFCEKVRSGTWPGIENIFMWTEGWYVIPDDGFSKLLEGMKRIISINFPEMKESFGPRCMELLRPHFSHLKVLDFMLDSGLTSSMAQEILSSCPLLSEVTVDRIDATDVITGKPWVCMNLVLLSASFRFNPLKIQDHQPLVLDQLSRLTRMERLTLDGCRDSTSERESSLAFQETFDLRLQMGLTKLSTLKSLQYISFRSTRQIMGPNEVEWINEHWKDLEGISGVFHSWKPDFSRELRGRLGEKVFASIIDEFLSEGMPEDG